MAIRLAVAVGLAAVTLVACSATATAPVTVTVTSIETTTVTATPTADSFPMNGILELWGGADNFIDDGVSCAGRGGYSDLAVGAQVTVYDATGKIVTSGKVGSSRPDGTQCRMSWAVTHVPAGAGPYQYEISHRGRMTVTEDEARAGEVSAEIGR